MQVFGYTMFVIMLVEILPTMIIGKVKIIGKHHCIGLISTSQRIDKKFVDMILHKGDRVWFKGDKKPFRVRAANEKFAICTKPYNFTPNTVIYTIVDFEWNIRGMDNMIFGIYSYYSDEECEEALQALTNGELEVSSKTHKHTRLEIERIVKHSNFAKIGKN